MAVKPDYLEQHPHDIELLIEDLAFFVASKAPEVLRLFEVFAQEARFAREWLRQSLINLKSGASILEVGSGLMILSCQLVREGYAVTALEPIGCGFSDFESLQKIILDYAGSTGIKPAVITDPVEKLTSEYPFDFAFSVNVMEHIENVDEGIKTIYQALKPGATYRFVCPNYLFPYEPHFNIPTLFSKHLTELVFRARIFGNDSVGNPKLLWKSLNWINVQKIKKACKKLDNAGFSFDSGILGVSLERMVKDQKFASRRPVWLNKIAQLIISLRLHQISTWLPATVLPIIDCTITKVPQILANANLSIHGA